MDMDGYGMLEYRPFESTPYCSLSVQCEIVKGSNDNESNNVEGLFYLEHFLT